MFISYFTFFICSLQNDPCIFRVRFSKPCKQTASGEGSPLTGFRIFTSYTFDLLA
jgi:hypothetical protein